jgi:hypothetical protein
MRRRPEPPQPSASVYVQPTPHGLWSGNNNFGFEVPFRPESRNRQQIIKLPEWGEPAVWTVSLGLDYSEAAWPANLVRGFEIVGEISYGIGGAIETAFVDWIQGTTFSLPMNAISVSAFYTVLTIEGPPAVQPNDVMLRVLLARGELSTGVRPSKHALLLDGQLFATLVDGTVSTPTARIPKFGRHLFAVPRTSDDYEALVASTNFIRFFSAPDVTGSALPVGAVRLTESAIREGVRVPPFAKYVTVENVGGGSASAAIGFNFELQL